MSFGDITLKSGLKTNQNFNTQTPTKVQTAKNENVSLFDKEKQGLSTTSSKEEKSDYQQLMEDAAFASELLAGVQNGEDWAMQEANNIELQEAQGPFASMMEQITSVFAKAKQLASGDDKQLQEKQV